MIIGLTGSIAMGKSATSAMFKKLGYPVFDADGAVHKLYDKGGEAALQIAQLFPDVMQDGVVDRKRLSQKIASDETVFPQIEKIVHPLVWLLEKEFISTHKQAGSKLIIIDNPLLFEANRIEEVDIIVVVSAPLTVQRQRALQRPGMTPEKLDLIIARQLPDEEKRARADYVIETDISLENAFEQVKKMVKELDPDNSGLNK